MPDRRTEGMKILSSFSDHEFSLNGHNKNDAEFILNQYLELTDYILPGDYLEVGCGTGMFCRFLHDFSGKRIIPHGVDIDPEKIAIAKRNNPGFEDNFKTDDALDLIPSAMPRFSTVAIFVPNRKGYWKSFGELTLSILEEGKAGRVIFFIYDKDLSAGDDPEVESFLSGIGDDLKAKVASFNFITIDPA